MLRFKDKLELEKLAANPPKPGDVVLVAKGPFEGQDQLIELCVWVFQRGDEDAAATEMTTGHHDDDHPHEPGQLPTVGGEHVKVVDDGGGEFHWEMPLRQVGDEALAAGDAFGVAVAMLRPKTDQHQQRVVWWGHPITLDGPEGAAEEVDPEPKQAY